MNQVDTTKWDLKVAQINQLTPLAIKAAVDFGLDVLLTDVIDNLSGSSFDDPGSYPVPVRTGNLKRSVADAYPKRVSDELGVVGSSSEIAGYNKKVHDGDKYHEPRPFITDAVRDNRDSIRDELEALILTPIRQVGRS